MPAYQDPIPLTAPIAARELPPDNAVAASRLALVYIQHSTTVEHETWPFRTTKH